MSPLISVIVPVYNMESYLDRCIRSILRQTYQNLEIILVDDGSTDSSPSKCDEYARLDPRVNVIHKSNGGLSSARNAGLDVCSGDFIGFVDSDDWIDLTMYETLVAMCNDYNRIATIGMNEITVAGDQVGEIIFENQVVSSEMLVRRILCHKDGGSVCSRLFSRSAIVDLRFDETKLNEDVLFMIAVASSVEHVAYASNVGYYYFRREGSISRHFGKALHDMVYNSVQIRAQIRDKFPTLSKEAERFEIFQHMSFLLSCPFDYDWEKDSLLREVLVYVRKHVLAGINNPCLTLKEKLKLIGVSIFPRVMSWMAEKKVAVDRKNVS